MWRKFKGIEQKEGGGSDFILLAGVRRDVFFLLVKLKTLHSECVFLYRFHCDYYYYYY